MESAAQPSGVLVIRLGSLGDVANTLPAVRALKECLPAAQVGWLVEAPSAELIRLSGVADQIILFPRKRLSELLRRPWRWPAALAAVLQLRRQLRAPGYPCVLDFQGNLKSGFLAVLSGARGPRRVCSRPLPGDELALQQRPGAPVVEETPARGEKYGAGAGPCSGPRAASGRSRSRTSGMSRRSSGSWPQFPVKGLW